MTTADPIHAFNRHRKDGPCRTSKILSVVLFLGTCMTVAIAAPPRGEVVAKSGNGAGAMPCVVCHGASGQGQPAAGFPRLAGMNALYVSKQLKNFRDGGRSHAVMGPVAQTLDDADIVALGRYYATLNAVDDPASSPVDPGLVAAGKIIALRGDWSRGLPGCAECHGARGFGVGASFPQLAGQSAPYLANQLESWRSGTRTNDAMHLMQGVATKLGPTDIHSVASYYSSLSAVPPVKASKP